MKIGSIILGVFLSLAAAVGQSQTYLKVTSEGTDSLVVPMGTTYRIGIAVCPVANNGPAWSANIVAPAIQTFNGISIGEFAVPDPCVNTVKDVQVLETPSVQTLTLNGVAFTVPALASPVLPPAPLANSVRICQEPCTIVSVSDTTATIFRYAVGTGTGAPVAKYALKKAAAYTVVYTYVPNPGGLQHTLVIPAPPTPVGTVSSTGVFTAQNPGTATITATSAGVSGSTTVTVTYPSPVANSVRICQEPCNIVSVSDSTATIFRFALGTGTGAPVGKYALRDGAAYTVVYTYVPKEPNGLQHTVIVPAYPLSTISAIDSNGVVTHVNAQGILALTWPMPAATPAATAKPAVAPAIKK